jgi:cellulose synthase/poly-beta-1,6-N-acetylglucosamine synthase-like glycosyltransferase
MTPLPNAPVIKDIVKDHPLVTVMIPTFNQADFVGEAIESAARQDYPNLEVVICDDASTDGTQADELPTTGGSSMSLRMVRGL